MAETGFVIAGVGSTDTSFGSVGWTQPTNIQADDGNVALTTTSANSTRYLKGLQFGLNLPPGATIDGIQVRCQAHLESGDATNFIRVRLVKDGVIGTTDKAADTALTGTPADHDFGGVADLWSEIWAVQDIEDATFGAVVAFNTPSGGGTIHVDFLAINVTFTPLSLTGAGRGNPLRQPSARMMR